METVRDENQVLHKLARGMLTESIKLGNANNWDGLPVSWALALTELKDYMDNSEVDHAAGYRAVNGIPEPLSELDALRQRVSELEAALAPFADAGDGFNEGTAEDDLYYIECGMIYDNIILSDDSTLKIKHLKRAYELLG